MEVPTLLPLSDDVVSFQLCDLARSDRSAVSGAMADGYIVYSCVPDLELVVAAAAEREVGRIVHDFEGSDSDGDVEWAQGDGQVDDVEGDRDEVDGGEEATEAMGDLFVAADRLLNAPRDAFVAAELNAAASVAATCLPPYGIEAPVWQNVRHLAGRVRSDLKEGADDDVVVSDARALRDFLRSYV